MPLGDRLERRGLIVGLFVLSALGLLVRASSHSFAMLLVGTIVTGASSVAVQILVPFAATLAAPNERGRVIGTVMSGLLLGILLARAVAGVLAGVGGWHTVYWIARVRYCSPPGCCGAGCRAIRSMRNWRTRSWWPRC